MKISRLIVLVALSLTLPSLADAEELTGKMKQGELLFTYWCVPCHGPGIGNGVPYLPGENALRAKYKGTLPSLLQERTDLTPDFVKTIVRHGITIMPFFRKTEISDEELDALATYLSRNHH